MSEKEWSKLIHGGDGKSAEEREEEELKLQDNYYIFPIFIF